MTTLSDLLIPFNDPPLPDQTFGSHENPSYLRRAIRRILEAHQIEFETAKAKQIGRSPPATMKTRTSTHKQFVAPDKDSFQAAIECSYALLQISPAALERINTKYAVDENVEPPMPDWLPAPGRFSICCSLKCTTCTSNQREQTLFEEAKLGTLSKQLDVHGQTRFEIDLEDPFTIAYKKLWPDEVDAASPRLLKMKITFRSLDDAKEFEVEIGTAEPSPLKALALNAKWKDASRCPAKDSLVKGTITRNRAKEPLVGWGFRFGDFAWSKNRGTPLEIWNRAQLCPAMIKHSHEEETVEKHRPYHLTYMWIGDGSASRTLQKDSLSCIYCQAQPPYSSFTNLHHHYISVHDYFSFRIVDDRQCDDEVTKKTIYIDLLQPQPGEASNHLYGAEEFTWIKPDRPLDVESYLKSDRSWVEEGLTTCMRRSGYREASREDLEDLAVAPVITASDPQLERLLSDLPAKQKRSFEVPNLPNVTFFRTASKRVVRPGEVLEESDGEADDSWLHTRHVHQSPLADGRSRSGPVDEVTILYDAYVRSEDPLGTQYLPRTILRFCDRHGALLRQPAMLAALDVKLALLTRYGHITEQDKAECLGLIQSQQTRKHGLQAISNKGKRLNDVKDIRMISDPADDSARQVTNCANRAGLRLHASGTRTEASTECSGNSHGIANGGMHDYRVSMRNSVCICGLPCTTARGIIYCAETNCSRPEFHMKCVGLTTRVLEWRCPDCRPQVQASVAPMAVM